MKVGLIMIRNAKWKDLKDIKKTISKLKLLDLVATEIDGVFTIMFFVSAVLGDFNLISGLLELSYDTKSIFDI